MQFQYIDKFNFHYFLTVLAKKSNVKICIKVNKNTVEESPIKTMLSSKNLADFAKKNKIRRKKLMFVKKLLNDGKIIPLESVI